MCPLPVSIFSGWLSLVKFSLVFLLIKAYILQIFFFFHYFSLYVAFKLSTHYILFACVRVGLQFLRDQLLQLKSLASVTFIEAIISYKWVWLLLTFSFVSLKTYSCEIQSPHLMSFCLLKYCYIENLRLIFFTLLISWSFDSLINDTSGLSHHQQSHSLKIQYSACMSSSLKSCNMLLHTTPPDIR